MDNVIPDNWKDWTATEFIGEGSYGQVYKAENASGQVCAIKIIEIPKTKEEEDSIRREYGDEETVKSFYTNLAEEYEKEIRLLDSLKEAKNIVRIYDYCKEPNGVGWKIYIRMEHLQRFTEYCDVNEITEDRIVDFAFDICNALIQCEQQGIIHRDLKPENILVDAQGTLKLCDFGLARTMNASRGSYSVKGTFDYMAPEVFLGKKYNNQVDIYSLGLMLYRLLNKGREPFAPLDKKIVYYRDKESALSRRMDGEKFPDPVDATPEMAAIVQKACAYHPEDRYQNASGMMEDLRKLQKGSFRKSLLTNTQRKRLFLLLTAAVLAVAGGAGYVWTQVLHGVHASVSSDGVLTVYGNRAVTNDTVIKYRDKATSLVIREGIPRIEDGCFDSFEQVETVQIPDSVTEIGAGAFALCTGLKEIDLAESNIAKIGGGAFEGCTSLKEITLPDTLPVIEASALNGCSQLKDVDFGNSSPTLIDENAFSGCGALEAVRIPDSVETVGVSAFEDCEKLEAVQLGKDTKTLEDTAFSGCSALKEVDGIENVASFGGDVFTGTEWEKETAGPDGFLTVNGVLLHYLGTAESVRIPNEADTVGNSAFADANTVRTVTIGKNVKRIDDLAFAYSMISEFVFEDPDSIEYIGEDAFSETPWLQQQTNEAKTVKIGKHTIKGDE